MESVDDMLGWDTNSGDENSRTGVNDDVGQLIEFAFGIIVAIALLVVCSLWELCESCLSARHVIPLFAYFVFLADPPTCGRSKSTPNGAFLSVRKDFNSAICSRSISGV